MTRRAIVVLLLVVAGCGEQAAVTGTVGGRVELSLPPGAVLEVVLEDISRADAPAVTVGREIRTDAGQPPFRFAIPYDPRAIDPAHTYAVRARVTVGDRLLWTTDQVYPVLTRGYGRRIDLLLVEAGGGGGLRGMFRYLADAALFTDCATSRRHPVAMAGDYPALERAYLEARPEPGGEVLATFAGRLEERPAMEGGGTVETVVVERFEGVWPGETCGNPGATATLENTYWKLTRLQDAPVRIVANQREPHLIMRSTEGRVVGSGGCNQFHGSYTLEGDALAFGGLAGTMMACPEGTAQEQSFLQALGAVARWRLEGQHLELLDEDGARLLRLEARAFP